MALRDQPYLPLYIQDYLTDEKLNECSAATQGIYIKLMCLLHKSETYGKILLKQKYKQNESMCLNFASQVANHLPFSKLELESAIKELINENVCYLENEFLCQKRMIKDNDLSLKRSKAGKKGGDNNKFAKAKVKANIEANSEYEYENIFILDSKEFYKNESERVNDIKYNSFVNYILGENDTKEPYTSILNLQRQVSFEQFTKLLIAAKEKNVKIKSMLDDIENTSSYTQNKKDLFLILNKWIKNARINN